jgi:hypothetical protein
MSLERLEDFVRQMVGQAPTRLFVQTLLVLDRAEHQSAEAKAKMADKVAAAAGARPAARRRAPQAADPRSWRAAAAVGRESGGG